MAGTVTEIWLSLVTKNLAAAAPNLTAVAPVKLKPSIVTVEPGGPRTGLKSVTSGAAELVKLVALTALPDGVTTLIGPVPGLLVRPICKGVSAVMASLTPLMVTLVADDKFTPSMVTEAPIAPMPGEKSVISGPFPVERLL